jgi:hypothetical protein
MPQASCHVLSRAVICCHVLTVILLYSQGSISEQLTLSGGYPKRANSFNPAIVESLYSYNVGVVR